MRNTIVFSQKVGINPHVACMHAHQKNGSVEHKHHHIMEFGISLLASATMPLKFGLKLSSHPLFSLISLLPKC
jgi:histone deacetylase 1/2